MADLIPDLYWPRMVRWLKTVLISLLPMGIAALTLHMVGKSIADEISARPELLFVALVLGSSAIYDIIASTRVATDLKIRIMGLLMLLVTLAAAIVYGINVLAVNIPEPNDLSLSVMVNLAVVLTSLSFLGATGIQLKIAFEELDGYDS